MQQGGRQAAGEAGRRQTASIQTEIKSDRRTNTKKDTKRHKKRLTDKNRKTDR